MGECCDEGRDAGVVGGVIASIGVAMLYWVGLCCVLIVVLSVALRVVAVACCLCRCHRLLRCVL